MPGRSLAGSFARGERPRREAANRLDGEVEIGRLAAWNRAVAKLESVAIAFVRQEYSFAAERPPRAAGWGFENASAGPARVSLPLRNLVFWLHLATGCLVGALVAVMALTGVLLAFEEQVTTWADGRVAAPSGSDAVRLVPSTLVAEAAASVADAEPSRLQVFSDPRRPAEVRFGRRQTVLVDPWSGRALGGGNVAVRQAFDTLTSIHRWLGGEGERRDVGRRVTGAANLAFAGLLVTGLYLWVPPLLTRRRLRHVTWFRRGLSGRSRDFNWHHVVGVWLAVPLLLIVLSGAAISYPWATGLLYRVAGEEPPRRDGERERDLDAAAAPGPWTAIDAAWRTAVAREPGWRSLRLDLPPADATKVVVSVQRGGRGRPDLRRSVTVGLVSGTVLAVRTFDDESGGRRLRSWVRWIHTGEAGGLVGQALAAVASAGALALVWTGWALAWRRFFPRRYRSPRFENARSIAGRRQRAGRDDLEEATP